MPPKKSKTQKAIAAELKKKNTEEAMDIISSLKRKEPNRTASTVITIPKPIEVSISDSADVHKSNGSEAVDKPIENVLKKGRDAATARKTFTAQKEKSKRPNETKMNLKNFESPPKTCEVTSNKTSAGNGKSKKGAKNFFYEIDCTRVEDTVNVNDLQIYLKDQLKLNGKKGNLGDTVAVSCIDQKVIISSKVFLPKRSLRFLSKKFLKKNWNIQVVSKSRNSYEFKYVGTA